MKQRGFAQGIFDASSVKKEELGTLRVGQNGKSYRYARAGATDLAAGVFTVGVATAAAHQNEAITAAVAIGTRNLTVTVTAGTAIVADEFQGGEFLICDGTGQGHSYEIDSNTAISASGTEINLSLKRPIKVALDTTSEFTLFRNPFYGAIVSTTLTLPLIGVTPCAVTANYYFWAQRTGLCSCIEDTTTTVAGNPCQQGNAVAGTVEVAAAHTIHKIGISLYAAAATESTAVWLMLE